MTRYLATTALTFATILAAAPAAAETIDFDGNSVIIDQLTPPGGRCVPTFANTVSFAPGEAAGDAVAAAKGDGELAVDDVGRGLRVDAEAGRLAKGAEIAGAGRTDRKSVV